MTHVSTIKTNTQTMTPEALQEAIRNGSIDSTKITDVSVFSQSADTSQCSDGKDDGKIGFFDALGSTLKGAVDGVVNGIKGCFFDENGNFSLGNTLKTALTVGACFIPGVGPVIATGLCAYGAVKGGVGIAKGVAAAASAETDAEAKAAFESIGANGVATAASAVGLKASASALASNVTGSATGSTLKNLGSVKNAVTKSFKTGNGITDKLANAADTLTGGYYGSAWNSATGSTVQKLGQVAQSSLKDTGANIYKAYDVTKNTIKDKTAKITKKKTDSNLTSETVITDSSANAKTTTKTKNVSDLPEDIQQSIKDGNSTGHIDNNTTYKTVGDGKVEVTTTTPGKVKTTYNTELLKDQSKAVQKEVGKLSAGQSTNIKGKTYTNLGDGYVEITTSKNLGLAGETLYNLENAATVNGYQGLTSNGGNVKAAVGALSSNALNNSADEIENQIPYASQTFATVDIQSGYEYDLQDYTIMDEDQVNESYSQIMANAYGL